MDLDIDVCELSGCVLAVVRGECDIVTAPVLRERLLGSLAGRPATMVLDLSGLDFLDCAGARISLAAGCPGRLAAQSCPQLPAPGKRPPPAAGASLPEPSCGVRC